LTISSRQEIAESTVATSATTGSDLWTSFNRWR
jgi:hypothetical protein